MLTFFRRHTKACKETHAVTIGGVKTPRDMGRDFRKCSCPIHTEGTLSGVMIRRALDTGNWNRAAAIVQSKEAAGVWVDETEKAAVSKPEIAECVRTFLDSLCTKSTGRSGSTMRGMRTVLDSCVAEYKNKCELRAEKEGRKSRTIGLGLVEYSARVGATYLDEVTLPFLVKYGATWECSAQQRSKRIQLLRRFFRFAVACEWVKNNPAMGMEHPKGRAMAAQQKAPYDANFLPTDNGPEWAAMVKYCSTRPALWALVALMRFTGMRISDATTFNASSIMEDGSIMLRMTKTGGVVTLPMHPTVKAALQAVEPNAGGYYFTSGEASVKTATDNWRVRLVKMFKASNVAQGHAHRFRHTFAVDLLLRGVPLDQVSQLLGHYSTKITEKHYISFVAKRRAQLRDSVLLAWGMTGAATPPPAAPVLTMVPVRKGRKVA